MRDIKMSLRDIGKRRFEKTIDTLAKATDRLTGILNNRLGYLEARASVFGCTVMNDGGSFGDYSCNKNLPIVYRNSYYISGLFIQHGFEDLTEDLQRNRYKVNLAVKRNLVFPSQMEFKIGVCMNGDIGNAIQSAIWTAIGFRGYIPQPDAVDKLIGWFWEHFSPEARIYGKVR